MSSNFLVFHNSGGISSIPAAFPFLIFLSTESSSSQVNCPSLMSNCLLIIGSCVLCLIIYLAPYLFIICLDYVLRTSTDKMKDNGIKLTKERGRRYPGQTTDADYTDNIAFLANTLTPAESLLHSLERAAAGIGLHVNAHKTKYMCFNQRGDIYTLNESSLKPVDKFT